MYFNPVSIQTIGIGLAAFLSTLIASFILLSARKEQLGRTMGTLVAMIAVWSWFGFLYEIVPNLALARELRVISVMGIVWLSMASVNFSLTYMKERVRFSQWTRDIFSFFIAVNALLTLILIGDLFGGRLIVGDLLKSTDQVLAPNAGPLLSIVIAYYALCTVVTGILFAIRARASMDKFDRRQAEILFSSITLALTFGGTRFAPWYGIDFQPIVGACAVPLFVFAAFYSIKRYKLLNVEVAVAQLLIFALWTFTFFRVLLNPTIKNAVPDIGLFFTVLILGIFLLRSITTEIRTHKELARMTIEHIKTEFVMVAAHQLRAPLATIHQAFNLLLSKNFEGAFAKGQRDMIQLGNMATNNMVLIVNDLLNVARISKGIFDLVIEQGDVRNAIRSSGVVFEEAAKNKNVQLMLDLPQSPLQTRFDRGKLVLAIENLIDNAIKYTQSGGSVSVSASRDGDKILIKIMDTGIGISDDDHARLFEKFFRGKSAMQMNPDGSGLGLFIAKNIIDGHNGTISIASTEGSGTNATISLPISTA